jgi:hypothetical protein
VSATGTETGAGRVARRPGASPGQAVALLIGFGAAVALRSAVGGAGVARSAPAGLVFAACLLALAAAGAVPVRRPASAARHLGGAAGIGLGGAVVLCVPAVLHRLGGAELPVGREGLASWALVVLVVAGSEEVFLRGTLFRLLEPRGPVVAVLVPAVAFAALHVPLYGWGAAPLDLAVGVWLGALRVVGGSWIAPAVAHVLADVAAWWLV